MRTLACAVLIAAITLPAAVPAVAADWTLIEHPDAVLMYDTLRLSEFSDSGSSLRSGNRGYFLPTATLQDDGTLTPYADGMQVGGELRAGQMLLTPDDDIAISWAEFVLHG